MGKEGRLRAASCAAPGPATEATEEEAVAPADSAGVPAGGAGTGMGNAIVLSSGAAGSAACGVAHGGGGCDGGAYGGG